ncbi:hypothetical protein [Humibacter sp.]|uniref:hypothetical protein n=1 Tax=Humibacter sp. TaxID=1940291 RepID=UPI002C3A2DE3|nr:hypothetical protein [Humibacter sp.]HVX09322.1 hypothetical protein [Humibacter sp.]
MRKKEDCRVQAATYSELGQIAMVSSSSGWKADFVGRLRLDRLLFRHIVLPDAAVIDGLCFHLFDPADLALELAAERHGDDAVIEIRARADTMADSLRTVLDFEGSPRGIWFDSINDDGLRDCLARGLSRLTPKQHRAVLASENAPRALADLLRRIARAEGFAELGDIERMEAGWARWCGTPSKNFQVRRWQDPQQSYETALNVTRLFSHLLTDDARSVLVEAQQRFQSQNKPLRTKMRQFFATARRQADGRTADEITYIERWMETGWERMVAWANECTYASDSLSSPFRVGANSTTDDNAIDKLEPTSFVRILGAIPADDFREMTSRLSDIRDRWLTKGQFDDLHSLIERCVDITYARGAAVEPDRAADTRDFFVDLTSLAGGSGAGWALAMTGVTSSADSAVVGGVAAAIPIVANHARSLFEARARSRLVGRVVEFYSRAALPVGHP